MNSYKANRKCNEYVFSNSSVLELLGDIKSWFEGNPSSAQKLEAFMETLTIEYDSHDNVYIASVFISNE